MPDRILIDPITRIEGHAKITLRLDDASDRIVELCGDVAGRP